MVYFQTIKKIRQALLNFHPKGISSDCVLSVIHNNRLVTSALPMQYNTIIFKYKLN